jgi:hypothetical protein
LRVGKINAIIPERGVCFFNKLRHEKIISHAAVALHVVWITFYGGIQISEVVACEIGVVMKVVDAGAKF